MHKDTPIFLNVGDMDLSSEGVRDFYWPVSFQEVNEVRDETVYPLVRLLREGLRREVRGSIELSIVAPWLVTEIMSVFQAEAFRARTGDHKVVNLPPNMPIWEASLAGRQPAPPLFFESLQNSFPPRRLSEVLQKPFRLMSSFAWKMKPLVLPEGPRPPHVTAFSYDPYLGVEMKRICTRRLTRSTLQKKIVCTRRGGIFSAHAASVDSEVVLGRHKFWFHPISSQMVKRKMKEGLDASLRHNLLQIVLDVFHAHGEVLPPWHVDYFDMVFCRGAATIGVHLERLMRRPEKLPAVLWTGTGGNIWDRMLRYAVRSNGGSV
ncbi:MAG: hypothetical protein KKB70_11410, partial [Proteobacteria bacterium]|nr:hypothetical protein [Pseudomonadota bacterium]